VAVDVLVPWPKFVVKQVKESVLKLEERLFARVKKRAKSHAIVIFVVLHIFAVCFIGIAAGVVGDAYGVHEGSAASYMRLVPVPESSAHAN
jgi:hypothetical protein